MPCRCLHCVYSPRDLRHLELFGFAGHHQLAVSVPVQVHELSKCGGPIQEWNASDQRLFGLGPSIGVQFSIHETTSRSGSGT